MFENFPKDVKVVMDWSWAEFEPYAGDLLARDLTADTLESFIADSSDFTAMLSEVHTRRYIAKDIDTTDEAAAAAYKNHMATIHPEFQKFLFMMGKKLVDSGLEMPEGFDVPMRNIRAQIEIFRMENLPLETQLSELATEYNKISGAQTVEWEGEEKTITQMQTVYLDTDREKREKAWYLTQARMKEDREALNDIWRQMMDIRKQIATNADLEDYRAYAWKSRNRFDYTPEDALAFCDAIEQAVVPAMRRLSEKRRLQMRLDTLRPWDTAVDPFGRDPLKPFEDVEELMAKTETMFNQVDPLLGGYYKTMRDEKLLDLDNRKGKAPGGYNTGLAVSRRSFIFMNAVGVHRDVQTMLHEAGHAFHGFERHKLPYMHMRQSPMEFNEVASMAMELLAAPYLTEDRGGFYDESQAARARIEHLEKNISFWPYMAVVVAFQHWIYTNHDAATDASNCDAKWLQLWGRFMQGVDYSGLEDHILNRWRRQLHIFRVPFYYIEYGLAQLGAVQVWARSLKDHAQALADYKAALALGGTATLPQLYETAGAKLAFDAETLGAAVELMEKTINELEASLAV